MKRLKLLQLVILSSALLGVQVSAQNTLQPYAVSLNVKRQGIQAGTMTIELTRSNQLWQASTLLEPSFFARMLGISKTRETTVFACTTGLCSPRLYRLEDKKNKTQIAFDERLETYRNARNEDVKLPKNYQTYLSLFATLNSAIANQISKTEYPIFNNNAFKNFQIALQFNQSLNTAAGKFNTVKVMVEHGNRKRVAWLAIDHYYAPVKIENYKEGERVLTATLKQIR